MRTGQDNPPAAVRKLSLWLGALGYTDGAISSVFYIAMHVDVMEFQCRNGLTVDGIFGMRSFERMRSLMQAAARERLMADFPDAQITEAGHVVCPALPMAKGLKNFTFRADAAFLFMQMTRELEGLGVRIPSAGGIRPLSAKVTAGRIATSMHYPGLAFDIHTGAAMNKPESDLFVVEHTGDRNWRVWARTQNNAVPLRTIANPYTYTQRSGTGVPVTGRFVDFTAIAEKWHFVPIKGRPAFFDTTRTNGSVYSLAEWWHFQCEFFLMEGFSTFGDEVRALYGDAAADRAPARVKNNFSATFGVNWH
jgi:hypothetical protein